MNDAAEHGGAEARAKAARERLLGALSDAATAALAAVLLFAGIGRAGLWEAVELDAAEAARAIAEGRARDGALGVKLVALAFTTFGTSTLVGRVALTMVGALGVGIAHVAIARLEGRAAGRATALVLASTPLFFAQSWSLAGHVVAMTACAAASCGLALAAFDRAAGARAIGLCVGVVGLWAGASTSGATVGLAVPVLAVGVASLVTERAALGVAGTTLGLATTAFALAHSTSGRAATFDAALGPVLHGAFPWSALLPLAIAHRTSGQPVRVAMALLVIFSCGASALGAGPFVGAIGVSVLVGAAFGGARSRGAKTAPEPEPIPMLAIVCTLALAALLALDFERLPEKLAAPVNDPIAVPTAIAASGARLAVVAALLVVLAALIATRRTPLAGSLALSVGLGAAAVVRFGIVARLFSTSSADPVVAAYDRSHVEGEPLALLGVSKAAARYAGAPDASSLASAEEANAWLAEAGTRAAPEGGRPRRFVAVARRELAPLNALVRARTSHNAPVLFGGEGSVALVTNALRDEEQSESPLDAIVVDGPPADATRVDVELGGGTLVLEAWSLAPRSTTEVGGRHLRLYWRVGSAPGAQWCTFVHVDRTPTRFSAEHRDWPEYPMSLWRARDVVVDDFAIPSPRLGAEPPHVYVGVGALPCQDDRRMSVTRGPSDGHDRISLGRVP